MADHDRPLSHRGRLQAEAVARYLERQGLKPHLILASAAERARATARAVAGAGDDVTELWSLYGAGPAVMVEVLRELPGDAACVLVVAHNPGLEELVQQLTGQRVGLSPATLIRVSLPLERWRDLASGSRGRLEEAWRADAI